MVRFPACNVWLPEGIPLNIRGIILELWIKVLTHPQSAYRGFMILMSSLEHNPFQDPAVPFVRKKSSTWNTWNSQDLVAGLIIFHFSIFVYIYIYIHILGILIPTDKPFVREVETTNQWPSLCVKETHQVYWVYSITFCTPVTKLNTTENWE